MRGKRKRMLMISINRKFTFAWPHNQNYLAQSKKQSQPLDAITISVTGHLDRLSNINFYAMANVALSLSLSRHFNTLHYHNHYCSPHYLRNIQDNIRDKSYSQRVIFTPYTQSETTVTILANIFSLTVQQGLKVNIQKSWPCLQRNTPQISCKNMVRYQDKYYHFWNGASISAKPWSRWQGVQVRWVSSFSEFLKFSIISSSDCSCSFSSKTCSSSGQSHVPAGFPGARPARGRQLTSSP